MSAREIMRQQLTAEKHSDDHDHDHDHSDHDHSHDEHEQHSHPAVPEGRLVRALILTSIILLVEIAGGFLSNSLALLADAAHMATDVFALGLSLFALVQSRRPADSRRTFGYHRVGILAALLNAGSLLPISAFIIWEAIGRFSTPSEVEGGIMFGVAAIGLVANLIIGINLHQIGGENLNIRSAVIHVIGDAVASAGVLVGAVVIAFTGWQAIDPILSILIALLVAFSGWRVVRETVRILLESAPRNVDVDVLVQKMEAVEGVENVHDLHIWEISQGINALSCHVRVTPAAAQRAGTILETLNRILVGEFKITHSTIQTECAGCEQNSRFCSLAAAGNADLHMH